MGLLYVSPRDLKYHIVSTLLEILDYCSGVITVRFEVDGFQPFLRF